MFQIISSMMFRFQTVKTFPAAEEQYFFIENRLIDWLIDRCFTPYRYNFRHLMTVPFDVRYMFLYPSESYVHRSESYVHPSESFESCAYPVKWCLYPIESYWSLEALIKTVFGDTSWFNMIIYIVYTAELVCMHLKIK